MAEDVKSNPAGNEPKGDVEFAQTAAMGGMMEVQLGELAEKQGENPKIKEFGKMMVTDHSKVNDKLKSIAAKQSIELPKALDEKHQKKVDKLAKLQGAEFDKAYAEAMTKAHEKDLKLFQKEAKKGDDAELKAFALETSTVIQQRLDHIKGIAAELK